MFTTKKGSESHLSKDTGAIFAELAITLPILLGLTFFIYWSFLALSWRDSIYTAVYNGVDLAAGRGDPVALGLASSGESDPEGLIPTLDNFKNNGVWNGGKLGTAGNRGLLSSGSTSGNIKNFYNDYIDHADRWPGKTLDDFPRQTLYAMAFAYHILSTALFSDTKFPCDPDEPDNYGCLICFPASPSTFGITASDGIPEEAFGIECRYKPSTAFLSTMSGLLGVNTSSLVIAHDRMYDPDSLDSF